MSKREELRYLRTINRKKEGRKVYRSTVTGKRYKYWIIEIEHPDCTCDNYIEEQQTYVAHDFNKSQRKWFYKCQTERGHDTELHLILPNHIREIVVFNYKKEAVKLVRNFGLTEIQL